jgi:hypothetical protein
MRALALVAALPLVSIAAEPAQEAATIASMTGYFYAMRDQPDFGVAVGMLHLESAARYFIVSAGATF